MSMLRHLALLAATAGALGAFAASEANAAEIHLGGMVPGAGVIRKDVTSMKEAKYADLVRQHTDFSCGAAAVATILRYGFGMDIDEEGALHGLLRISDRKRVFEQGFSLLDLKTYAQANGLQSEGFEVRPEALDQINVPTIVLINIKGYQHFVVLKKTKGDRVYLADPALGNKVMPRDEFLAAWNGIVLVMIGASYDENTILRRPAEPLSARRLMTHHAPFATAQLPDFGFTHSDLLNF